MPLKNVLFDFGDTLVQASSDYSQDTCLAFLIDSLAQNGISVPAENFKRAYEAVYKEIHVRNSVREISYDLMLSRTLSLCGFYLNHTDKAITEGTEAFMACWIKGKTMEKSVPSILRRLKETYVLGVVSNLQYSPAVRETLERFGVADYFSAIIVSADVGWRKPSPKIFKKAFLTLRISASETVYVGDELDHDVMGAKKVGMHAILFKRPTTNMAASNVKPDAIIDEWKELPQTIETLGKQ